MYQQAFGVLESKEFFFFNKIVFRIKNRDNYKLLTCGLARI